MKEKTEKKLDETEYIKEIINKAVREMYEQTMKHYKERFLTCLVLICEGLHKVVLVSTETYKFIFTSLSVDETQIYKLVGNRFFWFLS